MGQATERCMESPKVATWQGSVPHLFSPWMVPPSAEGFSESCAPDMVCPTSSSVWEESYCSYSQRDFISPEAMVLDSRRLLFIF